MNYFNQKTINLRSQFIRCSIGNVRYTITDEHPEGEKVIIQEHSLGHDRGGVGDQEPHVNVRPDHNRKTGTVKGTKEHYYLKDHRSN